jgi:hypothetical protein
MERTVIDFPCNLFAAIARDWIIDVRGRGGSESVAGNGQVVYGSQPRWVATLDFNLIGRDRVLVWQAITAKMRGRVNLMRICACDPFQPTFAEMGLSAAQIAEIGTSIPHSDEAFFDDDSGYSQGPVLSGVVAARGATSFTVDATPVNDALQPGHMFSVDDYLYRVTGVSGVMASRTYEFEPPLREAMVATDSIDLRPHVIVAFDGDLEARAKLGSGGKVGAASIAITEWVNR